MLVGMRFGRRRRAVLLVLAAIALVTIPARRASAGVVDEIAAATVSGVFAIGASPAVAVAGTTFTAHDALAAKRPPPADHGWCVAEAAVATPLAVGYSLLMSWYFHDGKVDHPFLTAVFVLPSAWMSGLAIHGFWGLNAPETDPRLLLGGSLAAGANLALTVGALAAGVDGRLPGWAFGAYEMALTAPSIAVGTYELVAPGRPYKPAFAGLTAWSTVLFAHGIASVVMGVKAQHEKDEKQKNDAPAPRRATGLPRLTLAPTVLAGGPVPASALVAAGVW
jgi:hypothetical protein